MPKLIDFKSRSGLKIRNTASDTAEIIIYAGIGTDYWGDGSMISAKTFSDELKKIPDTVKNISVRINSPGGDVFDGIAIYNRLKQHKANITVHIDGLAASIASVIALAGNEIFIGEGALYMVHLPWTWAVGDRTALENTISRLMDVEEQLIGIYSKKSGMDRNEIRALLEAETWMDAEQAIDLGFVDKQSEESIPIAASVFESKWIKNRPKTFKSETSFVSSEIENLKQKIAGIIAHK